MTVRIDPLQYDEPTYEGDGPTVDAALAMAVRSRREAFERLGIPPESQDLWQELDLFLRVRVYGDDSIHVKAILR